MTQSNFTKQQLIKESIFKVGSVFSVSGRRVKVKVNKNKNASHLLFQGEILKNISVNSYIKITKGFTKIIGKVEGEYIETKRVYNREYNKEEDLIERYLEVSLFGHFDNVTFRQGIKEMPLVDNECYLLDKDEFEALHYFHKEGEKTIDIGSLTEEPSQKIKVSINSLFASHIGIFGNTGSGKSNTLAKIYYELFQEMRGIDTFKEKSKFLIIDFNGEYGKDDADKIITADKKVYVLNTRKADGQDKLPLKESDLIDLELISILANATEKTQKPFIERTINFYRKIHDKQETNTSTIEQQVLEHFKNLLRLNLKNIFASVAKEKAHTLLDYIKIILDVGGDEVKNYDWSNTHAYFFLKVRGHSAGQITATDIENTNLFQKVDSYTFPANSLSKFIHFLYLQIIFDVYNDNAQNDHIVPAINKLKSKQRDIEKIFDTEQEFELFGEDKNLIVINLKDVNTDTKKTLPLLIAKKLYEEHKSKNDFKGKSLHIIIDEAHNILSDSSERESESWKDYRLETFEEIIKEGRKFNTFLTIASQRPHDISATIISQLHNYFIHKLINEFDINAIHRTVAYLDKLSFESIPILSTGSCFFAGLATNLPVKVSIAPLDKDCKPNSETIELESIWTEVDDTEIEDYEEQELGEEEQLV